MPKKKKIGRPALAGKVPFSIALTGQQYRKLIAASVISGKSMSAIMRGLVDAFKAMP